MITDQGRVKLRGGKRNARTHASVVAREQRQQCRDEGDNTGQIGEDDTRSDATGNGRLRYRG